MSTTPAAPTATIPPAGRPDVEDIHPVTPLQQGMLHHVLREPGAAMYLQQYAALVTGPFDPALYAGGWQEAVDRHAALRASFHWQGFDRALQVVRRKAVLPVTIADWSGEADPLARLDAFLAEDRARGFALDRAPLIRLTIARLGAGTHAVVTTLHHVVADGWSLGLAFGDVARVYAGGGTAPALPPAPPLRHYVDWLAGRDTAAARDFWARTLDGAAPARLPFDRGPAAADAGPQDHGLVERVLPRDQTAAIQAAARRIGITEASLFQAAWGLLLARHDAQPRALFATTSTSRPAEIPGVEQIFGPLLAILPVAVTIDDEATAADWLRRVQALLVEARQHDHLPLTGIRAAAGIAPGIELLTSMTVWENMPLASLDPFATRGIRFTERATFEKTSYPLMLAGFPGAEIRLRLAHDPRRITGAEAGLLLDRLVGLIRALTADPDRRMAAIGLETDGAAVVDGGPALLRAEDDLFDELARGLGARGAAPALIGADGTVAAADLLADAAAWDAAMAEAGLKAGDILALALPPGRALAGALLGALRRGVVAAPLDPARPTASIAELARGAGIRVLAGTGDVPGLARLDPATVLAGRPAFAARAAAPARLAARAPAVLIHTSGSTGRPKGVLLARDALLNRLRWAMDSLPAAAGDLACLKTSPAFVDALAELLHPLAAGFPALVPAPAVARDPAALLAEIRRQGVTRLVLTPSVAAVMLAADPAPETSWPLRVLHLSGEALSRSLVQQLYSRLAPDALLLNLYGSSEVTADVTATRLSRGDDGPVPIGRPLPGARLAVLDPAGRPVPVGAVGELHVRGTVLALGYHGDADRTAHAFQPADDGPRHATGDLVALDGQGRLIHRGRRDGQIKIRGMRIEPGEIESRLRDHPEVQDAVAAAIDCGGTDLPDRRLIAHVTTGGGPAGDPELAVARWRTVYDGEYAGIARDGADPLADYRIWRNSHDGSPIPADQMAEWVETTVARIRALAPRRVLEIGCGQGFLLARIAPGTEAFLGTDISAAALDTIRGLQARRPDLGHVRLALCEATAVLPAALVPPGGFDLVVVNSVVQYLPDIGHLARMLAALKPVLAPDGRVFLGDLRNLAANPALRTDILFRTAPDALDRAAIRDRIGAALAAETELVLHPSAVARLAAGILPGAAVQTMPRRGFADNELTACRFDALIRQGVTATAALPAAIPWVGPDALAAALAAGPEMLAVTGIPHRRLFRPHLAAQLLDQAADAGDWRRRVAAADADPAGCGADPEQLYDLADRAGYTLDLQLDADGLGFRAVFRRGPAGPPVVWPAGEDARPLDDLVSHPERLAAAERLTLALRSHLEAVLPPAMVPDLVLLHDDWPRTPTGKIDRQALDGAARSAIRRRGGAGTPPATATERRLAGIWSGLLKTAGVAREDDFLALGGNSLLATQLAFSVGRAFGIDFPLKTAYASPVLADQAALIDRLAAGHGGDVAAGAAAGTAADPRDDLSLVDDLSPPPGPVPSWPDGPAALLMTGVPALVAGWILARALDDPAARVTVIEEAADDAAALRALTARLGAWGLWTPDRARRLTVIAGRLDRPALGLAPGRWAALSREIDVVLHTGARIHFAEDYARLRTANVQGIREVLAFAAGGRAKPVHYLGSFGIVDHTAADAPPFDEAGDPGGPDGLGTGYLASRWAADRLLCRAIARGWPVMLHRATTIAGDRLHHRVDAGEMTWRLIRAMALVDAMPETGRVLDLVRPDDLADAFLALAKAGPGGGGDAQAGRITHLSGGAPLDWDDVAEVLRGRGFALPRIATADWTGRVRRLAATRPEDADLAALVPLLAETDHIARQRPVDATRTHARLAALGLGLPALDRAGLRLCLDALADAGLLPAAGIRAAE
ncbi:AMP-binding protein (plasmid) [Tistrella mobilis]|uniref:condensation domain-containing protein n=1 Tax=Tistrella mobilis TaxID=171437 RepID=UPI0035576F07